MRAEAMKKPGVPRTHTASSVRVTLLLLAGKISLSIHHAVAQHPLKDL